MPNVIEIHLVDGVTVHTVADSLAQLQGQLTGLDPWRVVENRKGQQVAIRLDQITHLVDIGEPKSGTATFA